MSNGKSTKLLKTSNKEKHFKQNKDKNDNKCLRWHLSEKTEEQHVKVLKEKTVNPEFKTQQKYL